MTIEEIQQEVAAWVSHNFPNHHSWHPILGMQEELGELSHAYLKRTQGVRTTENHDAAIEDAVGDLLIYLLDFCNTQGIDARDVLHRTWLQVRKRDWTIDSAKGDTP